MDDVARFLCVLLFILALMTVIGHGIWVMLAAILRWLQAEPPTDRGVGSYCSNCGTRIPSVIERCPGCGKPKQTPPAAASWRDDLQATFRQLERLLSRQQLDADAYREMVERLQVFEQSMQAGQTPASPPIPPVIRTAPESAERPKTPPIRDRGVPSPAGQRPVAVEPLDAILIEPESPAEPAGPAAVSPHAAPAASVTAPTPPPVGAPGPVHPLDREYVEQPPRPSIARRTLAEVFQSFMVEKNIRWGELVSGLLIVGSAVGLVISLRATLRDTIPYFPALIFLMVTLAIYGSGMYTLRRWNLQATSRGILTIALLLAPLNFVAAIVLSGPDQRPVTDPWYMAAVSLGVLVCGWITFSAGRALIGTAWWRLTVAVLATSIGQLIVDRQTQASLTAGGAFLAMAIPLGGYLVAVLAQILRGAGWRRLSARRAQQTFVVLGVATFSFLAPVALYLSHADSLRAAVANLSPVVSAVAGIILASGLLVHLRAEARALATVRTVGTSLAVAGAMLMISAVVLAWPRPELLIFVGVVNFVTLAVLAILGRLPVLHAPGVACLSLAALVGFHVWQANVSVGSETSSIELTRWLLAGRSGALLSLLAVFSVAAAAVWDRLGRRGDAAAYLLSGAGLGALSLLVAAWSGFGPGADTPLATPIFAFYALAALAASLVVSRLEPLRLPLAQALTWGAAVLWFAALIHGLWLNDVCTAWLSEWVIAPDRPWTLALLAHSLSISAVALVLTAPQLLVAVEKRAGGAWAAVVPSLIGAGLGSASIAAILALRVVGYDFVPSSIYLACASVAWLATAAIYREPTALSVFQAVASLAVVYATAGSSDRWWPMRDGRGFEELLQVEVIVLGYWCLAWSLLRRLLRSRTVVHGVLRAAWPTVDEVLLAGSIAIVAGLSLAVAWHGLSFEVTARGSTVAHANEAATWIALAVVSVALLVSLVDRAAAWPLIGLLFAGASAVLLLSILGPASTTASAWRWWSAGFAVLTAVAIWLRGPIHAGLSRIRWLAPWEFPAATTAIVRETALTLGAAPILLITTLIAIRSAYALPVGIVPETSFFGQMSTTVSYAVPLVALVVVLLGHALRERQPRFAVAGSVVLQYVVSLAFLLQVSPHQAGFAAGLLQWNAVALAGYSLIWLALDRRMNPERAPERDLLLGGQVGVTVAVLGILGVWAALSVFLTPGTFAAADEPLGQPLSYVAWLATCAAAVWYAYSRKHATVDTMLRPAVACGWLLIALIAVTVDPLDVSRQWLAYHVLTYGGLLLAAGLTVAWWRWPQLVREAAVSGGLVFVLAVRGGLTDPHFLAPWWSIVACAAVAVQAAVFSFRRRSQLWAYASSLAAFVAMTLYWLGPFQGRWRRDEVQGAFELVMADLVALLIAAGVWLAAEIWWQRRAGSKGLDERFRGPRLHVLVSLVNLVVLSLLFFAATPINSVALAELGKPFVDLVAGGGWLAILLLMTVLVATMWDTRSGHAISGIYFAGLVFAALVIDRARLYPSTLLVVVLATTAAYVMVTGWIWRQGAALASLGASWGIPEPVAGLKRTATWLPSVNLCLTLGTSFVALIVVSFFGDRTHRYTAAATPAMLAVGMGALTQMHRRSALQFLALLMTGLAAVYIGWADLAPQWDLEGLLLRMFRLLMVLSALTFIYSLLVPRVLDPRSSWLSNVHRVASVFGFTGLVSLFGVLLLELLTFRAGGVPVAGAQVAAVAVVLVALIAGLIAMALQFASGPFRLSEQGRMAYVYAAELAAALLFVHLYLCRPYWFDDLLRPYWPYIMMAIAFAGVAVGELCQRSGLRVLSEPLVRTGAFLPLLPALGCWVVVAEGTDYSALLFIVGILYVLLSILRRSAASAFAAVIAGNGALWALLHDNGFSLWQQPQFWLIPPALSALIAGQLNRRRLTAEQLTALRYASVLVIYVSSTSEMFLRGIGDSLWPPMVLATLSVCGVLLGIVLRVRAFLYLGSSFVLLSVVSMVWHASKAIEQSWPWWAFGIGLGLAILAMFAVFERKRPEIERWIASMRQWEQ